MNNLRLRLARLALVLGTVSVTAACYAPSIPPPPPGQTVEFTSQLISDGAGGQKTMWIAHGPPLADGGATPFSRVSVFDTNRGTGVIAVVAPDGSYISPPFDGTLDDRVDISFETTDGAHSADVCFQLVLGAMAPLCP